MKPWFLALSALLCTPLQGADFASLCYHRFGPETPQDAYRISLDRLGAQLDWLKGEGWQSVSLSQVAAALEGKPLPAKAVLLSVDDGFVSGFEAAPVFEARGYRAVYFIVPAYTGNKGFCSWEQLRQLEQRGHSVGSHAMNHPNLAKVPKGQSPQDYTAWLDQELRGSREELEKELGHPVQDLAWPYGAYNNAVIAAAQKAGYKRLYTVNGVLADGAALDALRLPRFLLKGSPSLKAFARRFEPSRPLAEHKGIADGDVVFQAPGKTRGFHFLSQGRDRLLYQVAPEAWRPHFYALTSTPTP